MQPGMSARRLAVGLMAAGLVAAGCSAGATPTPTGAFPIHVQLTPSHASVAAAVDQGLVKGINLTYTLVGYGESSQLFQAGTDPIGNESAWEAAVYQSSGRDVRYFGTAEAQNMISAIIIRKEDENKYKTLADLKGQTVGIPGFGSGTYAAFQVVAKAISNLNTKTDMKLVEGDPGSLEGLLQTKKVEAFITFTAPTAHALSNPAYKSIYNLTDEWKKAHGAYLPINGWEAEAKWLDEHTEIAKNFIAGVDAGREYLQAHLDEYTTKYKDFSQGEGALSSPETTDMVKSWIKDGYNYLPANLYTQAWVDSVYEFIKLGEGVLIDQGKLPAKDKVFYSGTLYK